MKNKLNYRLDSKKSDEAILLSPDGILEYLCDDVYCDGIGHATLFSTFKVDTYLVQAVLQAYGISYDKCRWRERDEFGDYYHNDWEVNIDDFKDISPRFYNRLSLYNKIKANEIKNQAKTDHNEKS